MLCGRPTFCYTLVWQQNFGFFGAFVRCKLGCQLGDCCNSLVVMLPVPVSMFLLLPHQCYTRSYESSWWSDRLLQSLLMCTTFFMVESKLYPRFFAQSEALIRPGPTLITMFLLTFASCLIATTRNSVFSSLSFNLFILIHTLMSLTQFSSMVIQRSSSPGRFGLKLW